MDGTLIRCIQLVTAILGVIFAATYQNTYLVIAFAVSLIYLVLLFLSILLGRTIFSGRVQNIFDIICGILILVITIWVTIDNKQGSSSMHVAALVCGYILGPLFFISASGI